MAGNKPVPLPPISASDIERFKAKVNTAQGQGPNGDCHAFIGGLHHGYGRFCYAQYSFLATRVAWFIETGKDPGMLHVLHKCDWPACARLDHLFLGNQTDNMRDRQAKGRTPRGATIYGANFIDDDVREIRERVDGGEMQLTIAKEKKVSKTCICLIANRVTWKHVE